MAENKEPKLAFTRKYYEEVRISGVRKKRDESLSFCENHGYEVVSYKLNKVDRSRFILIARRRLTNAVVIGGRG